jgi:aminopeptidase N
MRRALLAATAILLGSASGSAQRLSDVIVPHHYDLTFAPEFTNDRFTGAESIEVEIRRPTRTIVLHALDLELSAVRITQRNVTQPARVELDRDNEQASLTVERPLTTGRATIELRFAGRLTGSLEGLYDAEILAVAKRRADRYLLNERDADPTMLDTVILLAARDGDDTLYDRLRSRATSQGSPQDAERALFALTQFTDPKLISRTLEYAVSPEVRRQDVPLLLGAMLRNPASREIAWSFVKTRWSDVSAKIEGPFGSLVGATSGFCDARLRDDVREFFTEHPVPGSDRPLRQAIESMENCIRMKDQQAHHLAAWLP